MSRNKLVCVARVLMGGVPSRRNMPVCVAATHVCFLNFRVLGLQSGHVSALRHTTVVKVAHNILSARVVYTRARRGVLFRATAQCTHTHRK